MFSALYPGEVYPVDSSKDEDYAFHAVHLGVWNRYPEQSRDLGPRLHIDIWWKEVHSREMKQQPEESELTAEFIQMIIGIVEIHLKKLLPKEYNHLRIWASSLPLKERSRAYPFGGHVLDIAPSTNGHRDDGDDIFCCMIPAENSVVQSLAYTRLGLYCALAPGMQSYSLPVRSPISICRS
ncbi:hypothetical protein K438DRAFT_1973818 [Mycena galopus ATCC 62051]|nr:hypothetical protein K438DRAFT_1973818 [Mycena galopus ATCC 62051]